MSIQDVLILVKKGSVDIETAEDSIGSYISAVCLASALVGFLGGAILMYLITKLA